MKKERSRDIEKLDPELEAEVEKVLSQIPKKVDYVNGIIRFAAAIFFCFMVVTDKLHHQFAPPLPDYWYGVAVGIILYGRDIGAIWFKLKKGK